MWFILAVILAMPPNERGLGSTFFPHERMNNGVFACGGKWTDPDQMVCAHRTVKCGTWILVEAVGSGRTAWCQVLDRGPYGALAPDGRWVRQAPGDARVSQARYRAVIDMGPAVTRALGVQGLGLVRLRWSFDAWWRGLLRRPRRPTI